VARGLRKPVESTASAKPGKNTEGGRQEEYPVLNKLYHILFRRRKLELIVLNISSEITWPNLPSLAV